MAGAADNDVVVDRDAQAAGGFLYLAGHFDVARRWGRVSGRMIVNHDDGRGAEIKRTLHHFAGIDGRVVDSARCLQFIGDQGILAIEKDDVELFAFFPRHGGVAVIKKLLPGGDGGTVQQAGLHHPQA
jgi:RNase P/RNase MRP subunit p29